MLTEPWYWDASDANRAFAKTFAPPMAAAIPP